MPTDREVMKDLDYGRFGSAGLADVRGAVNKLHYRTYTIAVQDAATAGTAVTETVIARVPHKCKLVAVYLTAPIAVAADNTDYATFTVAKRTAGAAGVTLATGDTRAASMNALAAFTDEQLPTTGTAVQLQLAAGDVLTFAAAKSGVGKALVAATSYFNVTVVVEEN